MTSSLYFLGSGSSLSRTFHSPLAESDHCNRLGSGGYSSIGTVMKVMLSRSVLRNW